METSNLRQFHSSDIKNPFSSKLEQLKYNELMAKFGGNVVMHRKGLSTTTCDVLFNNINNVPDDLVYRLCVHAADGNCGNFGVTIREIKENRFSVTVYTD